VTLTSALTSAPEGSRVPRGHEERFPLPRRVAAIGSVKGPVATEQLGPLALEGLTQPVSLSGKVLQ